MTAMMAFFMVMWLISIANPQELVQIAEYFKTPLKVALTGGQRSSDSESPIPAAAMIRRRRKAKCKNRSIWMRKSASWMTFA